MKKLLKNFNLLGFVMLMLGVMLGVGDVSGAMYADGTAFTAVGEGGGRVDGINHGEKQAIETTDVRDLRPDMIIDPVDQNIVKMRPSLTPLDTIMRYAKSKSTDSFEFKWYSTDIRPVSDTLISNATSTGSATKERVSVTLTPSNVELFDITDTLYFPSVLGEDGEPLMLYVNTKTAGANGTLTCSVIGEQMKETSGNYNLPNTITSGTEFYRLGRAAAETDVLTPSISIFPIDETGYCQIFKCQLAESSYEKMQKHEVKWDASEIEEQALYEFRLAIEASFLFGRKAKIYDPVKKKTIYTTGGITRQITKNLTLDVSDPDEGNANLVTLTKQIFQGNAGAETRYVFAGSGFVEYLSKIQSVEKQVEAGNTMVAWGMEWNAIKSNFGTLALMQHDLFDMYGWTNKAVVIDPQFLDKYTLKGLERFSVDAKGAAILDGDITVFTEASGLALRYNSVHAIVTLTNGNTPIA